MSIIVLIIIVFLPVVFVLIERKGEYIYIKGAKIPSKYWKTAIIIWFGGITGLIFGLFLNHIFGVQFLIKISIIFFVLAALLLSKIWT